MKVDAFKGDRGQLFDADGNNLLEHHDIIAADTETGICRRRIYDAEGEPVLEQTGTEIIDGKVVPKMSPKVESCRFAKPLKFIPDPEATRRAKDELKDLADANVCCSIGQGIVKTSAAVDRETAGCPETDDVPGKINDGMEEEAISVGPSKISIALDQLDCHRLLPHVLAKRRELIDKLVSQIVPPQILNPPDQTPDFADGSAEKAAVAALTGENDVTIQMMQSVGRLRVLLKRYNSWRAVDLKNMLGRANRNEFLGHEPKTLVLRHYADSPEGVELNFATFSGPLRPPYITVYSSGLADYPTHWENDIELEIPGAGTKAEATTSGAPPKGKLIDPYADEEKFRHDLKRSLCLLVDSLPDGCSADYEMSRPPLPDRFDGPREYAHPECCTRRITIHGPKRTAMAKTIVQLPAVGRLRCAAERDSAPDFPGNQYVEVAGSQDPAADSLIDIRP